MVVGRAGLETGRANGRRLVLRAVLAGAAAASPAPLLGCTLCHSDAAMLLRERVLAPDFWWNACTVTVPLLILFSIVAVVAYEPTGSGGKL